ncbi:hypothetical protein OG439_28655 [Amycolatopsis sp. NBC_01307]|uniref:hypothetical protein n=1 Tax=Amycolatopsis sp. NBC_01307 TaxID=2903561 RepID=UPI002E0E162B|nr:hypothetical protein OG439_28655 [Amycolatopsis sp. NBC_01307]
MRIDGTHYGHGIAYRCSMFCGEPRGVVEYDLGRKYRRFETAAGVLDDAADSGRTGHWPTGPTRPGHHCRRARGSRAACRTACRNSAGATRA